MTDEREVARRQGVLDKSQGVRFRDWTFPVSAKYQPGEFVSQIDVRLRVLVRDQAGSRVPIPIAARRRAR